MGNNIEVNKWFCLIYTVLFFGIVLVGCTMEQPLAEPIKVVLPDVGPPVTPEVTQEVKPVKYRYATITMYYSENCVWCDFWWGTHRANWEKQGWKVDKKHRMEYKGGNAPASVPFFVIDDTTKVFLVPKFLDGKTYTEYRGK